jgi:ABC-2 type transport system permease protein
MGDRAASPEWWGWTPPVAVETGLIAVLAVLALALATRKFSRVE